VILRAGLRVSANIECPVQADGLNAELRIGIPGDHRGMLNDERLFRLLKHFLKVGDPDPFYNPVWDFVFVPRSNLEFELDHPSIGSVEERSETWHLIVCEDGQNGKHFTETQEHCVATVTAGL